MPNLILPFEGDYPLTQEFNDKRYRSSYYGFGLLGHNGKDWGIPKGVPIYAPHGGVAKEVDYFDSGGYGNYIKIEDGIQGSILAHFMERSPVKNGQILKQGDLIGYVGSSGNSTGFHLHWGYWREPRNRDNGFNGFMDQTYWMNISKDNSECLITLNKIYDLTKGVLSK